MTSLHASPGRLLRVTSISSVVLVAAVVVAALCGPAGGASADWFVIRDLRLPRAATAGLVGAALAAAGATFQAILRNPLASPYLLGVSGGGTLGAVLAILFGLTNYLPGLWSLPVFSFLGCWAAISVIHLAASRHGNLPPHSLLLAGVVANSFFLAVVSVLQYLADPTQTDRIVLWTLGAIRPGSVPLPLTAGLILGGFLLVFSRSNHINVLVLGDETAGQLGIDIRRVRRRAFLGASLMTAAAVAVSGPIAFVGLFVPHAVRFFVGPDLRLLLPASCLVGASFLIVVDTAARAAFAPRELPVGVLTALIGAPCFMVLMSRSGVGEEQAR